MSNEKALEFYKSLPDNARNALAGAIIGINCIALADHAAMEAGVSEEQVAVMRKRIYLKFLTFAEEGHAISSAEVNTKSVLVNEFLRMLD